MSPREPSVPERSAAHEREIPAREREITGEPSPASSSDGGWRHVARRALYWLPVFTLMVLFAQVAVLGLRPALCERRRLADAEVELQARWQRDVRLRDEIVAGLRARQDPIFLERQRRLRQGPIAEARVEPVH